MLRRRTTHHLHRWLVRLGGMALLASTLLLAGCQATLFAGLNATDQHHNITQQHGIVFDPQHDLALDTYAPAHAEHAPVVVFFYGGSWTHGERAWYRFVGTALAARGVVVVIPDYRKVPGVRLDGFMQDAASAVAWAHDHAAELGGAPDDVFVMGHSAGGQIAALLATDPSWLGLHGLRPAELAGFIGLAGCYAFVPITDARDQDMRDAFGNSVAQQRRAEPVSHVRGAEPPMLLLHGIDDDEVPPSNAIALDQALRSHGEDVTLRLYPGLGHESLLFGFSRPLRGDAPTLLDVLDFIQDHPAARPLVQQHAPAP